jgi:hypothetical protein
MLCAVSRRAAIDGSAGRGEGGVMSHAFESEDEGDIGQPGANRLDQYDEVFDGDEASDDFVDAELGADAADEDSDALDAVADEFDGASADEGEGFETDDADIAAADAFDAGDGGADTLWSAFESDLAEALDVEGTDEFLGSVLGGISRAAGLLARGAAPFARGARRAAGAARGVGHVATGAGQLADSAAVLARALGAAGAARALRGFGAAARGVGRVAGSAGEALGSAASIPRQARRVAQVSGGAAAAPNPMLALMQAIGRLSSEGADDFEAFDAMADLYEDGVDEALPAVVGLAARAAARALGWNDVGQLSQAARRALVRGVSTAARSLVRSPEPRAVRALPRIAQSATRVAQRRHVPAPRVGNVVGRTVQRTAQQLARRPQAVRRLARPMAPAAPLARPTDLGRGVPSIARGDVRRFRVSGPVELIIQAR